MNYLIAYDLIKADETRYRNLEGVLTQLKARHIQDSAWELLDVGLTPDILTAVLGKVMDLREGGDRLYIASLTEPGLIINPLA